MQAKDLQRVAAAAAVTDMLLENRDAETAETLLKDEVNMISYTRLVFKLLFGVYSPEDLLRMTREALERRPSFRKSARSWID